MIGIIVALEKEVCSLLRKSEIIKEKTIAGKKFITCKLEDKNAVIAISNVGKVASAMTCQSLIYNFAPETILNFGSVGGIKEMAKPLSIYAVEKCCQYDFD